MKRFLSLSFVLVICALTMGCAGAAQAGAPVSEEAYAISLKECTDENITISLDAAEEEATLVLASYDKKGNMLALAVSDQPALPGFEMSVPYLDATDFIKALVLHPTSLFPLRKMWIETALMTPHENEDSGMPSVIPGQTAVERSRYIDGNGDDAVIPADFAVSENKDEQTVSTGLVVIGPDGSEYVWVPTSQTELAQRDFGSYFSGGNISSYRDETELESYKAMVSSVEQYGGFYIGRYEASFGGGKNLSDMVPASKRVTADEPGRIWVQFSPQDTTVVCENLYADNDTVQGFFPWGINWDTTLQWLIDSGCKTEKEVVSDSTGWGNYSNDDFSPNANGKYTGAWEEAKANNIYDLAGNNWEWTQERCGSSYVMRGGGYNLMGGSCPGSRYPAALRDPLPGNDHHPNVTFRAALYITAE